MFNEKMAPLTRSEIKRVKAKAIRRGVWFRILTRIERAYVDLVTIVVSEVRNCLLEKILISILKKLEQNFESRITHFMSKVGSNIAKKLSKAAQEWGNQQAADWAQDFGFIQFLSITYMNTQQ